MPFANTRCEANTKAHGTQCENGDAIWSEADKKLLCHLHHPDGRFRQQVKARHDLRKSPRRLNALSIRGPQVPFDLHGERPIETKGLDAPFNLSMTAGKGEEPKLSPRVRRRDGDMRQGDGPSAELPIAEPRR